MKKKFLVILLVLILTAISCVLLASCANEAKIEALQIIDFPKTEYLLGEKLDFKGASLLIKYQNGTDGKVAIDSSMVSSYDPMKIGDQFIIISYKNKSAGYKVTVKQARLENFNIELEDQNVDYIEGQNFNVEGAKLVLTYENGTVKKENLDIKMVYGYDKSAIGLQTVTIRYKEIISAEEEKDWQLKVQVTVVKKKISSVKVYKEPHINKYYVGHEEPDFNGGVLLISYNNGYADRINMYNIETHSLIENLSYNWNSSVARNDGVVNLVYYDNDQDLDFMTKFNVEILERKIINYDFLNSENDPVGQSILLEEIQNAPFSFNGYSVSLTYNQGDGETIKLDNHTNRYQVSSYDQSIRTVQEGYFQIVYNNVLLPTRIPIKLRVLSEEIKSLELILPETNYYVDTVIPYENWKFKYVYNSGNKSEEITVGNNLVITEFENMVPVKYSEPGSYNLHARLANDPSVIGQALLVINNMSIESIELVGNPMLSAYYGEAIADPAGTKIKVKYSNGEYIKVDNSEEILVRSSMITFDSSIVGVVQATIVYTDTKYNLQASVNIPINIVSKIQDIEVVSDPRLTYFVNEDFDFSSLEITYKFADAPETEIRKRGNAIIESGFFFDIDGQEDLKLRNDGEVTVFLKNSGLAVSVQFILTVVKKPIALRNIIFEDDENGLISHQKSLGEVIEGLDIDLTKKYVEVMYEGSNEYVNVAITKEMLNYKKEITTLGLRTVSLTYPVGQGVDISNQITLNDFNVMVVAKEIVALEIPSDSHPRLNKYVKGNVDEEFFIYDELKIVLVYSNNTLETVDANASEFVYGRVPMNSIGKKQIKISLVSNENIFTWYEVEVVEGDLKSIRWKYELSSVDNNQINWYNSTMPKTYISEGQELNFSRLYTKKEMVGGIQYPAIEFDRLTVVLIYQDNRQEEKLYSDIKGEILKVSDYQSNLGPSMQISKLHYKDKELKVHVEVGEKVIHSISIDDANISKIKAIVGGELVLEDVYIDVTYRARGAEGESAAATETYSHEKLEHKHINYSATNLEGYDKTNTTIGARFVKILYEGKSKTISIVVVEKHVISIVPLKPLKSIYLENEEYSYHAEGAPNEIPYLQIDYDNGQTDSSRNLSQLIAEGVLVIDTSEFNSSNFSGDPKTQTIKLKYTGLLDEVVTYQYEVIIHDRKNVNISISGQLNIEYGNTDEPSIVVRGYSSIFDENGNIDETSIANVDKARGDADTEGFYYVMYIPQAEYSTNHEAYISDLRYNSPLFNQLKPLMHFPTNAGTYKVVLRSFGDSIHNDFIVDSANNSQVRDLVISKKKISIIVKANSKIYGSNMPEMHLEIRPSKEASILDNPLDVFAPQDRLHGFLSPDFIDENNNDEKTPLYIVDKNGNKLSGYAAYLCFDVMYGNNEMRRIPQNLSVGLYVIKIGNTLSNPNYVLEFVNSEFTVVKREVKVKPIDGQIWMHGEARPVVKFTAHAIAGDADSGLYSNDKLNGNLGVILDISTMAGLRAKKPTDGEDVIGNLSINLGTLSASSNMNYNIILDNPSGDNEILVRYIKRTIYIKLISTIRVYGSTWNSNLISLIFTKEAAVNENQEDAFALGVNNLREQLSDLGQLKYIYKYIDATNQEIEISSIENGRGVGTVIVYPEFESTTGPKYNYYKVHLEQAEVKTIARKVLLTAQDAEKTYGDEDPEFLYSLSAIAGEVDSGMYSNDTLIGTLSRFDGENVGSYRINIGDMNTLNPNYQLVIGQINGRDAVLKIKNKKVYIDFESGDLSKVYDGKYAKISNSNISVYSLVNDEYLLLPDFDKNKVMVSIINANKQANQYEISLRASDPNFSASLKNTETKYSILPRPVNAQLRYNGELLNNITSLQYNPNGIILTATIPHEEIQYVYDENDIIKVDRFGNQEKDSVNVSVKVFVRGNEEVFEEKLTDIDSYKVLIYSISNVNYQITSNLESYIDVIAHKLYIKIRNADALTHKKIVIYNGKAINITSNDYEIVDVPQGTSLPEVKIEVLDIDVPPKDVILDSQGRISSYKIGITKNSNNPNYIYELYYQDYEYVIAPKPVTLSINSTSLQKQYNGTMPNLTPGDYTVTGLISPDVLTAENVMFVFNRASNDGRSNSDVGSYHVSVASRWANYSINLDQNYTYVIVQKQQNIILNRLPYYNPLEREYADTPELPFFSHDDFVFDANNRPFIKNFVGEESRNLYMEHISTLVSNMQTVRQSFYAIDVSLTRDAIINSSNVLIAAIDDIIIDDTIIYAYDFPRIKDNLNANLKTLKNRISEVANLYNSGQVVMKSKLEELSAYINNASTLIDKENSFISFTFKEEDQSEFNTVGKSLDFILNSNSYNIKYIWVESSTSVKIIKKKLIIEVPNVEIPYAKVPSNPIEEQIHYVVKNSKGEVISVALEGVPRRTNTNIGVGAYDINILEMQNNSNNTGLYSILLSQQTPTPKYIIVKSILTVKLNYIGEDGSIIYGPAIGNSKINKYKRFDPSDSENYEEAKAYFLLHNTDDVSADDPELMTKMIEFFGNVRYGEVADSSNVANIINTSNASFGLYSAESFNPESESNINLIGNSALDAGNYITGAMNFSASNYNIRVLFGKLKISRATATVRLSAGGKVSRVYSQGFELAFNYPGLPASASTDLDLYKEHQGQLTLIGKLSANPAIFIDTTNTNSILTNPQTAIDTDISEYYLLLTNAAEGGGKIVAKNFEFVFDNSGYGVVIAPKLLKIWVEKKNEKSRTLVATYGDFDRVIPSFSAGADRLNYKLVYEGLADWDTGLAYPNTDPKAPKVNLFSEAGVTKEINSSSFEWSQSVLAEYKNYTISVESSTITTNKKQINVGIDINKLKKAVSFYTSTITDIVKHEMKIYPYLSLLKYDKNALGEINGVISNEIVGGNYGPMDFILIDSLLGYDETLFQVLQKGEYVLPSNDPYRFLEVDGKELLATKNELLFNHKIDVTKETTGWKVVVSGISPNSNYQVAAAQTVYFSFDEAGLEYIHQIISLNPVDDNILFTDSNWKQNYSYFSLDTSLESDFLNSYLGKNNVDLPSSNIYKINPATHLDVEHTNTSLNPSVPNTPYEIMMKYNKSYSTYYGALPSDSGDYAGFFVEEGVSPNDIRVQTITNILNKDFSLPLQIFTNSTSMQDVATTVKAGYYTYENYYEANSPALFDRLDVKFKVDRKNVINNVFNMGIVLDFDSGTKTIDGVNVEYQELLYLSIGRIAQGADKHYAGEDDQFIRIVKQVLIKESGSPNYVLYSYLEGLPMSFKAMPDFLDGYYHEINIHLDKYRSAFHLRIDNSMAEVISIREMVDFANNTIKFMSLSELFVDATQPTSFGILISGVDLSIDRLSYGNQGYSESTGSKLYLSDNVKYIVSTQSFDIRTIVNQNKVKSDTLTIDYYFNGNIISNATENINLLKGLNKLEAYLKNGNTIVDRLKTYVYYDPAGTTIDAIASKPSDYRVIYTESSTQNRIVNFLNNSIYHNIDMSNGTKTNVLEAAYDSALAAAANDASKIQLTKDEGNTFKPFEKAMIKTPSIAYSEDNGYSYEFKPYANNIESYTMSFRLSTSDVINTSSAAFDSNSGYQVFEYSEEVTKFEIRLFSQFPTPRGILVNNNGIYYDSATPEPIKALSFQADKEYKLSIFKKEDKAFIIITEDGLQIAGNSISTTKLGIGRSFYANFKYGKAKLYDVLFNYNHYTNENNFISYDGKIVSADILTTIGQSSTEKTIIEKRRGLQLGLFTNGVTKFKYKHVNSAATKNLLLELLNEYNSQKLKLDFSGTNILFSYSDGTNWSANQVANVNINDNNEHEIEIYLDSTIYSSDAAAINAAAPGLLKNTATGDIYYKKIVVKVDSVANEFYLPINESTDSWEVKFDHSIDVYRAMIHHKDIGFNLSGFAIYAYSNFADTNWTITSSPQI